LLRYIYYKTLDASSQVNACILYAISILDVKTKQA